MLDSSKIDDLASKFSQSIPAGAKNFQQDLEKNFRQLLQSLVSKMDLVTREEFDVQSKVLQRTREKIEQLEKQMAQMEEDSAQ